MISIGEGEFIWEPFRRTTSAQLILNSPLIPGETFAILRYHRRGLLTHPVRSNMRCTGGCRWIHRCGREPSEGGEHWRSSWAEALFQRNCRFIVPSRPCSAISKPRTCRCTRDSAFVYTYTRARY